MEMQGARQMLALGSAALGALAALNSALSTAPAPPRPPTPGRAEHFAWTEGTVHYTVSGVGPPLLLVHGIDLAASSFEMRYVAEPLARAFRVYTIDLLGFGLSDRPKREYSAQLYVGLIADFLLQVVRSPANVIAAGLSAAYCVEVAARHPRLIRALVLSQPASMRETHAGPVRIRQAADALLGTPVLGQSLFNMMTARNGIRAYLREHAYNNPDLVTESMVDAQYAMAHQPNARYAGRAYLAGKLDLDISASFAALRQSILLVFGAHSQQPATATAAAYARRNPRAQVLLLERAGSLPHEEQAERFASVSTAWFKTDG